MLVNRHRWFFTESKINGVPSRTLDVIDGGRRKTLYLSNDGGVTPGSRPPMNGSDALPSCAIINEWYPKSLCELEVRMNIRIADECVANLPALAVDDWYVATVKRRYPNFPVDGRLRKEGRGGDNCVNA